MSLGGFAKIKSHATAPLSPTTFLRDLLKIWRPLNAQNASPGPTSFGEQTVPLQLQSYLSNSN